MKLVTRSALALLSLATSVTLALAAPTTWKIDPVHTEASFQVRHFFTQVKGVFHEIDGTIVFDEADASAIKVDASVKVASVDTGNPKRDGHLQTADFFQADKFPVLTLKSTKVTPAGKGKYKVTADLTMRGVTKPVTFDAEFLGSGDIAMDGQTRFTKAGFSATATVNRKDFGINWNKTLDNGGAVLDDKVTIVLNVEADKVEPAKAEATSSR
jgi:polyisoprenoid-binding protein YceI